MEMTINEIKESVAFAANIMRRLPAVKVQGYLCAWPKFCYDADDFPSQSNIWMTPLPQEIETMEEILEWLKCISIDKRRIVWLRACGMGWKKICSRMNKPRSTLARDYHYALFEVQNMLKSIPETKKSKSFETFVKKEIGAYFVDSLR